MVANAQQHRQKILYSRKVEQQKRQQALRIRKAKQHREDQLFLQTVALQLLNDEKKEAKERDRNRNPLFSF